MHPVLFQIGPFTVHTYGVFVAMAFLSATALAIREARRLGEDTDKILDLCLYVLIVAIVGSRVLYVVINWPAFERDPLEIVRIWHGGLVFYGGFIGALLTAWWYMRRKGLSLWKTVDIMAPSVAFGLFVGRIGCFFAGCCYGKAFDFPLAVTFTHPESLAPKGISLHPTQLYSSLNGLVIFAVLMWLRRIKSFEGQIFWTFALLYALMRSVIEFFRGDYRGMFLGDLISTSQLISLIMAAIAAAMLIILRQRNARS
ncbi:MAG: prolipoprotein diacylglyceryl transferase [Desulfobacterales bacterium]|nr:prolipoprotein diacylglyceryl transferase [Desulfobacterales bacterium]